MKRFFGTASLLWVAFVRMAIPFDLDQRIRHAGQDAVADLRG
jgi:hypothetical protein